MSTIPSKYSTFLNTLIYQQNNSNNPFSIYSELYSEKFFGKFNPFGFSEDLLDKEVRCPICLGRVSNAVKPVDCQHVFCSLCLKVWNKNSRTCPVCRALIKKIIKVDISEKSISFQGNIFAINFE